MSIIFNKPWETMGNFCCDPVVTLTVISTAVSAIGAIQEGQAASANAEYESNVALRNAEISKQQTKQDLETQDRERRLRRGAAMAAAGSSGVGIESFGDILSSNAIQEQMDLINIKQQGLLQQQNFQSESEFAKMRGKQAKTGSYISAGSAILGGASKLYTPSTSTNKTYYPKSGTTVVWNN